MDERLFRLDGRGALVVGAGSGIGRAIARAFGSVGAVVGCVDRSRETAETTAREIVAAGGSIIHIASQMGRVGAAGRPAYTATKGARIQLAKTMAADHAAQNVRV